MEDTRQIEAAALKETFQALGCSGWETLRSWAREARVVKTEQTGGRERADVVRLSHPALGVWETVLHGHGKGDVTVIEPSPAPGAPGPGRVKTRLPVAGRDGRSFSGDPKNPWSAIYREATGTKWRRR